MGTFNTYSDVKNFAVKEVKLKQTVLLKAARDQKAISEDHFQIAEGGACSAFATEWCSGKLW